MSRKAHGPVDLHTYPAEFLACRADRHPWRRVTDGELVRDSFGSVIEWTRWYVCPGCTKERHDTYNTYGERVGRRYVDPEGYASTADAPVNATSARAEELRRMLVNLGVSA